MTTYKTIAKTVKTDDGREVPFAEVLTGLSYALDLPLGQPGGYTLRTCWLGMHIGRHMGLSDEQMWELYYTLLLKDAGSSHICSKLFELFYNDDLVVQREFRKVNTQQFKEVWGFLRENAGVYEGGFAQLSRMISLLVQGKTLIVDVLKAKGETGAKIAKDLGFSQAVADAINAAEEHFNGKGWPRNLEGETIPLYARIALLAQLTESLRTDAGKEAAVANAAGRSGTWFDPKAVEALQMVAQDAAVWEKLEADDLREAVIALEPAERVIILTEDKLDSLIEAFARIIDNKSVFTEGHSKRVSEYAEATGKLDGMEMPVLRQLKRAALLHDIGKLSVSNAILDKPARLNEAETALVQKHVGLSEEILSRIGIFQQLAVVAGAHHERLDGLGYPNGKKIDDIPLDTRIITVADIYDSVTTTRPHRERMGNAKAFGILNGMRDGAVEGKYVDLLRKNVE